MNLFGKRLKKFKIDMFNKTIGMTIKHRNIQLQLVKKVDFFKKIDDFVRRCIIKKFFYSFCSTVFFSDMIKFSASNEKMFNGERFITGYTKRRLIISEYRLVGRIFQVP